MIDQIWRPEFEKVILKKQKCIESIHSHVSKICFVNKTCMQQFLNVLITKSLSKLRNPKWRIHYGGSKVGSQIQHGRDEVQETLNLTFP